MRRAARCPSAHARAILASVVLAAAPAAATAAPSYSLTDLGALTQAQAPVIRGPNTHGIAGGSGRPTDLQDGGGRRGLVFGSGPAARQLEGLGGLDEATVFAINDNGAFVGSANTQTAIRAFKGAPSGAVRELPPLPGDNASMAFGINGAGEAAGFSSGAGGERAVVWDADGRPRALPPVAGASGTRAIDISTSGDVAGVANGRTGRLPVAWRRGQPARLLQLIPGDSTGAANAINARGQAVGYTADAATVRHAALWSATGEVTRLGALPGTESSEAFGINDAGTVVGAARSGDTGRAFLWTRTGGLQDLNALVPRSHAVLTKAVGINDKGEIVAIGQEAPPGGPTSRDGHTASERPVRVFLLSPVRP